MDLERWQKVKLRPHMPDPPMMSLGHVTRNLFDERWDQVGDLILVILCCLSLKRY